VQTCALPISAETHRARLPRGDAEFPGAYPFTGPVSGFESGVAGDLELCVHVAEIARPLVSSRRFEAYLKLIRFAAVRPVLARADGKKPDLLELPQVGGKLVCTRKAGIEGQSLTVQNGRLIPAGHGRQVRQRLGYHASSMRNPAVVDPARGEPQAGGAR